MAAKTAKKAAKPMGRPRKPDASPESVARRDRYQRAQRGETRPRGRPKSDEVFHAIRLTLPQAMFRRLESFRTADEKMAGAALVVCVRYLIGKGLEVEGK